MKEQQEEIEFNQIEVLYCFILNGIEYRRMNDMGRIFGFCNAMNTKTGKWFQIAWNAKVKPVDKNLQHTEKK